MTVLNVLLGLAVLVAIVANQMRTQPVSYRRLRVAAVLGVIGVFQVSRAVDGHPIPLTGWVLLLAGLVIGVVIGVWRAYTMRLWISDGRVLVRGTGYTAGLWLLGIAVHVGVDLLTRAVAPAAEAVGSASILIFVGLSLGAQALATLQRARISFPHEAPALSV